MHADKTRWWTAIPISILFGFALGLADAELGRAAHDLGFRAGMATALSVNVLLPLVVISLAFTRPYFRAAWIGAISMTLAFIAGLAVIYPPPGAFSLRTLLRAVPPVLVVAGLGYVILGTLAVFVRRQFSKPPSGTSGFPG